MLCNGKREVQSRLPAGVREWCCVECLAYFPAIDFDDDGRGKLPEHERGQTTPGPGPREGEPWHGARGTGVRPPDPPPAKPRKRPIEVDDD